MKMFGTSRPTLDEYRRLKDSTNPHQRGFAFQLLLERVFRAAQFKVVPNPRAARPRQSDLIAMRGGQTYLVEAKWQRKPIDVSVIDSLITRIDSMPGPVVGVLVSHSEFAPSAVEQVERRRSRPVLLVGTDEMESVFEGFEDLNRLLQRKLNDLVIHGRVIRTPRRGTRTPGRRNDELFRAETSFVFPDGSRRDWISCGGDFGQFTFASKLPDIDWVTAPGSGVSVDLSLPMDQQTDIARLLSELAGMGWATPHGSWSISQATTCWYGSGGREFVNAIAAWRSRYQGLDRIHHTEQVCYVDDCAGGFYTFTADLDASASRRIRSGQLSFQLVGIPMDLEPIRNLCEAFDVRHEVYFRPRTERSVRNYPLRQLRAVPIKVIARVVAAIDADEPHRDGGEWVVGIVIKNPFLRSMEFSADRDFPVAIQDSECLVCTLGSWHYLKDPRRDYYLRNLEWAWTSDAAVVRPVADWRDQRPALRLREGSPRRRLVRSKPSEVGAQPGRSPRR
jgi:restriction endonuclease